jgi:hypothetical protein
MAVLTRTELAARILALPPALQAEAVGHLQAIYGPTTPRAPRRPPAPRPCQETTLAAFVTARRFQIDRHPFDWDRHRYLLPIYEAFTLSEGQAGLTLSIIKGAQMGLSVWAMLGMIFVAVRFPGAWVGYFLPDQAMSHIFSGNRFRPLVESNPGLRAQLGAERFSENNKRLRVLGESSLLFSYMGGETSTESVPLLGIFFDEVRRMDVTDIGLAEQRISHSSYPINVKLSTAGFPDADIDAAFKRTNQQHWHSRCRCAEGVDLAGIFPECLGIRPDAVWYRCPTCDTVIADPQDGQFIAHGPAGAPPGFHVPQTLSTYVSPAKLWEDWHNPEIDRGEFYRSRLGRPYIDVDAQLVTLDDLMACEHGDLVWPREGTNCAMGIDQKGMINDIVIKERTAAGKHRLVHLERIEDDEPFGTRLDALMRQYDVSLCVCDMLPNYNDAMRFAKRWPARVFLASYQEHDPMIVWLDRQRKERAVHAEAKFKYRVTINRYKGLHWSLSRFRLRLNEHPPRRGLIQTMRDDHGVTRPVAIAEEYYWKHVQRLVTQKETINDQQGTFRMVFVNVGLDPHYAHANLYADVALSRSGGGRVAIL